MSKQPAMSRIVTEYDNYILYRIRGEHYMVYHRNGDFLFSADTEEEALTEIAAMRES